MGNKTQSGKITEPPASEWQFCKALEGCLQHGLSREEATAIVNKGKDFADYYEHTVMSMMYFDYLKSGLPIDIWAINCPNVILEKYKDRAQNKEALELAMGV